MPRYVPPLGYGATELQVHPSNLREAGRPDWMASNPNIVCYNCENPGHYESRCPRLRVAPEIRAEHVQRINAISGQRRSYPPGSGQNDTQVQQEMEFLRRQVLEMRAGQIAAGQGQIAAGPRQFGAGYTSIAAGPAEGQIAAGPGQFGPGQGQIAVGPGQFGPGQGQITAGTGQFGSGQGQIAPGYTQLAAGPGQLMAGSEHGQLDRPRQGVTVNMVETDPVGMLASALDDMTYKDEAENQYADVLVCDGEDPKPAEKRKRAVSEGETSEPQPKSKRPTLKPVGSRRPGVAISEEDLATKQPAVSPANLLPKSKKKQWHPNDREPICMMKGQQTFNTMETLRDMEVRGMTYGQLFLLAPSTRQDVSYGLVEERAPSKKKGKSKVVSFAESISGPSGKALPEAIGRIVNFYMTANVMQSGRGYPLATLKRVLVDEGSVLNMMPLSLARKMGFTLQPQTKVVMRTAASTYHEIEYYVNLDITVAGIIASIRCYCLPDLDTRIAYTLLLGCRWMKQVPALGDYDKETYHIHDMAGYR